MRFMSGLALLFVYVFLLSFKHFDHLAWGRGSWSLCLLCICLLAMHTLIYVTFSLPPGVGLGGWLRLLLVALPGHFCLPFCSTEGYGWNCYPEWAISIGDPFDITTLFLPKIILWVIFSSVFTSDFRKLPVPLHLGNNTFFIIFGKIYTKLGK